MDAWRAHVSNAIETAGVKPCSIDRWHNKCSPGRLQIPALHHVHTVLFQCWASVVDCGPISTLVLLHPDIRLRDFKPNNIPANTKHFYNICTASSQRLRRWSDIVQMLYKYFVFAGMSLKWIK